MRRCVAVILGLAGVAGTAALADGVDGMPGPGRVVFRTYCASCHGIDARGTGPVAPSLRTQPADLTRLYEKYGTPLDRERVIEVIDGRAQREAHGTREMPVWGLRFFEDMNLPEETAEASKRATMIQLVEFLQSIQQVRGASASSGPRPGGFGE